MKSPIFLLFCLFFSFLIPTKAQYNPDSLWAIWSDEAQPLEARMEALQSIDMNEKGISRNNAPDTVYYRAQLMYDLAMANNMKKWIGRALLNKGNYHNTKGSFKEAIKFYTQGKELGENILNKDLIGKGSHNLGLIYMKQGEADKAIESFSKSIIYFEEVGNKHLQSVAMDASAMIYQFMKSDPKKALTYLEPSLKIKEELIKIDDSPKARFVLAGIKNTIKSIKESFEEVKDTLDLDAYNSDELKKENLAKKEQEIKTISTAVKSKKEDHGLEIDKEEEENIDETYSFLLETLKLTKNNGNKRSIAEILSKIGILHEMNNNLDSALYYYSQSLKINEDLGDKFLRGQTLGLIGKVQSLQGNIESGLNKLNQGRIIFKELGNLNEDSNLKNVIGSIYLNQKYYEEAIEIFTENLEYYKSNGNRMGEAGTLSNIGNALRSQGKTERAMDNYIEALKIFKEINYLQGVAGVNLEIGGINFEKKLYDLALNNKATSLSISKKIGYKEGISLAQTGIADIYFVQNKHTKAIAFASRSLELSRELGNIRHIMNSSKILSKSFKAKGKYQEALEMKELHEQMRDSIQSIENQKAVIQQKVQADYEKQKAIDDIENEKLVAIETQKKENQQKLSFAIGLGLLLISLLAVVIFNRLKLTRKQKAIIEQQKKKVEQSEKYKEQFLANMSHEIRTPMHAISGMTNILLRKQHLNHQEKFLNAIRQSSGNLVVILNDILDLSKIEAGKLDIQNISMNPREVVLGVSNLLKVKAEEKGLSLRTDLSVEIPEYIYGDPTRINQILLNLLGNAIKFTEKGSVSLSVTTDNDKLCFAIQDSGIGIPPDRLEYIFNSFEQVNDSITRKHRGTGLGLAITKQLITLQNGTIWVESKENVGSTFFFELPLLPLEANKELEVLITDDQLKEMAGELSGLNILVVEDDELNSIIVGEDLDYYFDNVKIGYAENGQLAIQEFESGKYDLILMDIQMPELNGYDATRAIRKIEKAKAMENPVPIIAMTASLLKSEINNCYTAGMDNYIPKPYKMNELIGPIYMELKK